jgi:hypothetical protein
LPSDNFFLQVQDLRADFPRKLLVHRVVDLRVCWDEGVVDGVDDIALNDGSDSRRECACNVVGDVGSQEELLNLYG